ncbi:MAG: hypothetical protein R2877_07075 [Bdellovibrionota bacterium]
MTFNLGNGSAPVNFLTNNRIVFENSAGTYNATYATYYIRLMGMACEELADDNAFLTDGSTIDYVWKKSLEPKLMPVQKQLKRRCSTKPAA